MWFLTVTLLGMWLNNATGDAGELEYDLHFTYPYASEADCEDAGEDALLDFEGVAVRYTCEPVA